MKEPEITPHVEKAARDLPDGWVIQLSVERGAAWIDLLDPDGIEVEFEHADRSLAEQIDEALALAAFVT